jgi:hypothetical protein
MSSASKSESTKPRSVVMSPLLALSALHGMDEAITQVDPEARVIAYADDCLVLHPDRSVLDPGQQLLRAWLAGIGLSLNVNKTHLSHPLEGDQPGMAFLGFVRHEVAYTAVMTPKGGHNLMCCHQVPYPDMRLESSSGVKLWGPCSLVLRDGHQTVRRDGDC